MINAQIKKLEVKFAEGQYGSSSDKFDVMRAKDIVKKFGLKAKKSGTGIFIGSQLEVIELEKFKSALHALNRGFFLNNDWKTLLENAERGQLCGFMVHNSI